MSNSFARPAIQARSIKTQKKLMDALEGLLRKKDFDAISVPDLAAEAGVAVGTVYRRFENKEALIPLLFELWKARSALQMETAAVEADEVACADLRQLLRKQMRAAYRFICEQAHILRAVHLQGRLRPQLIGEDWKQLWQDALAGNRAFLELVRDKVRQPDLDRAAEMMIYIANTALVEKALFNEDGPGYVVSAAGDAFADEIADIVFGYLSLSPA
ncbi:TetR/AcrR family transcriptional regulator [Henriciella marina]|uniref:TetR/AcrR family transcriptional regulator n=1 Tax=Henriciella marina TaxID=453851 RepID=A0ABT4LVX1_9PROT|nr:TetR/AcrR family transcriptional regulator [Henriciella marina]MCZ4298515.1 TetR/AcrR family transcriptional regulator [Henriciella marina]